MGGIIIGLGWIGGGICRRRKELGVGLVGAGFCFTLAACCSRLIISTFRITSLLFGIIEGFFSLLVRIFYFIMIYFIGLLFY